MRRLSRFSRPLNALFALWFAMVLGDPGVLHSCPMHGGHGAAHSAPAAAAAGHGEHAAHAAHAVPAADAGSPDATHHGDTPAPCSCVGHCCAAPAVAPVSPATTVAIPDAVARVRRPVAAPSSDAPASPDLRLPFGNGPPTA
jgi:hypothetical protein